MSNNITIARPYAKAAFAIAMQDKTIAEWSKLLQAAGWIMQQPKAQFFLQDPKLTAQQRYEWLVSMCDEIAIATGKNFLKLLAENQRLILLPEIAELFEEYRTEQGKIINVKVTSVYPLDKTEKENIAEVLRKRLQRDVTLEHHLDETLIGGMIIRADDEVIDGSLRTKLNRLRTALVNE